MKRSSTRPHLPSIRLVLITFLLVGIAATAMAQDLTGGLYLSASPDSRVATLAVEPFVPASMYIVFDVDYGPGFPEEEKGLFGWEARIHYPESMVVLSEALNPSTSLNFGVSQGNFLVGTGTCVDESQFPLAVVHIQTLALEQIHNQVLTLGPSDPSSVDPPDVPAWLGCASSNVGTIHRSDLPASETSLTINPDIGPDPFPLGSLYPSAQPFEQVGALEVAFAVPYSFYIVADIDVVDVGDPNRNLTDGLNGFQFGVDVPPEMIVLGAQSDCGISLGDNFNWLCQLATCVSVGTPLTLVSYQAINLSPLEDGVVSLRAAENGSSAVPSWLDCFGTEHEFVSWQDPLIINPTGVPGPSDRLNLIVGEGSGNVGETISVPVSLEVPVIVFKAGDATQVAGFDFSLSWGASQAHLIAVEPTDALAGWELASNIGSNTVSVSAAGLSQLTNLIRGVEVVNLIFQLQDRVGEGGITVQEATAFDVDLNALDVHSFDGLIISGCDKGDVVADGVVNSADAIRTLQIAVNLYDPSALEFCAADMDENGGINSADAVLVLRKAVGLGKAPAVASGPARMDLVARNNGEVLLSVDSAAGADAFVSFDPAALRFVSAIGAMDGLVAANVSHPGLVQIAFAAANPTSAEIALRFEALGEAATVELLGGTAHAADGSSLRTEIGSDAAVVDPQGGTPSHTSFFGAAPNPFNPSTQIRFALGEAGDVTIRIYDAAGRLVREMRELGLTAGEHAVPWNGRDGDGKSVASGVYILQLDTTTGVLTARATLLK